MVSQKETNSPGRERFFTVDLIRLLSMIAIAHFHIHEATFFSNQHHIETHGFFELPLEHYSRFMAFSGFSIILISFFLIGLFGMSPKKLKQLILIAIVGSLTLFVIYFEENSPLLEWDIYSFIAVSSVFIAIVKRSTWLLYGTAIVGTFLISLPPDVWDFPSLYESWFYGPVFGRYFALGGGSWPLLPWLGLPVSAFAMGRWIKNHPLWRSRLQFIDKKEILSWIALILFLSPWLGAFHPVPIGPDFYQFVQKVPRLSWLAHIILVIFGLRLGFVSKINDAAKSRAWLHWISKLYLNRLFFFFYIVNWVLIGFFANFEAFYIQHYPVFDVVVFALFPLTEWVCHSLIMAFKGITGFLKAKWHAAS